MTSVFVVRNKSLLARFVAREGIETDVFRGNRLLEKVCAALSRIPYENLTKINRYDSIIAPGRAKRFPDEVIGDYLDYGAGGTCFSLTAAYVAVLDALGIESHPILADRGYGNDTHCALILPKDADLYLLDPGYLIHEPVRLPVASPRIIPRRFNRIELVPLDAGRRVELATVVGDGRRSRLTYKLSPVDAETFCLAWDRSFAWEMMRYPVLTHCLDGIQVYLQDSVLRVRDGERTVKSVLSARDRYEFITRSFGIDRGIVRRALSMVT